MPQYNDCMASALTAQVGSGALPDQLYSWLLLNGASAGNLNDLWNQMWDAFSISAGDFNDRAYEWLGTLGYTQGDLNDRYLAFWCDGGVVSTETNLLLNSRLCDNLDDGSPDSWAKTAVDPSFAILAKRTTTNSLWLLEAAISGVSELSQTNSLAADSYVASFRIESKKAVTVDWKPGIISGVNVTIVEDFPTIENAGVPGWLHCKFTVSALSDVKFDILAEAGAAATEQIVVSRPQIVVGTSFANGTWTGSECTGDPIELAYDANGELLKDANGDHLYVKS